MRPSSAPLTYFEFFYSPGKGALESVGHLEELSNKLGSKLHVIVLTREPEATVTRLLGEKVSPLLVVALGAERDFGNFGVSYIPFGVLGSMPATGPSGWATREPSPLKPSNNHYLK